MNWGSFLDNAKAVAEKAKKAAESLEGQLNESVGVPQDVSHTLSVVKRSVTSFRTSSTGDEDEDPFGEDGFYNSDDDFDVAMHDGETNHIQTAGIFEQSNQNEVEDSSYNKKEEMISPGEIEEDLSGSDKHDNKEELLGVIDEFENNQDIEEQQITSGNLSSDSIRLQHNQQIDEGNVNSDAPRTESQVTHSINLTKEIPIDQQDIGCHSEKNGNTSVDVSKGEHSVERSNQKLITLEAALLEAREIIRRKEDQIVEKDQQISKILELHQVDKKALELKVKETKDEAKKRIAIAKEKVESLKSQLAKVESKTENSDTSLKKDQDEIIAALRKEGEKLAIKQSNMEQLIKDARWDIKNLREELEKEQTSRDAAEKKIIDLEKELKDTKETLSAAQAKGGLVEKLDCDLLAAKEEKEKHSVIISKLENELKSARADSLELKKEMDSRLQDMLNLMESENSANMKEKEKLLNDLEIKLKTVEREANLREDTLRQEVTELRKRWQDAVRRCDALNIDLQQSCGPLLRQLESAERQSRSKAMAWAELECKLRSDLEDSLEKNEAIMNEKIKLEIDLSSVRRDMNGKESELKVANIRLEEASKNLVETKKKYEILLKDLDDLRVKQNKLEQRQKDNELKIRSEMKVTLSESEEKYNQHIESLEIELRQEKERRQSFEDQIKEITERKKEINADQSQVLLISQKRSLGRTDPQASILQSTLFNLGNTEKEDVDDFVDNYYSQSPCNTNSSFAFWEQMSQSLSAKQSELETLRNQLNESETRRTILENEIALCKEHLSYKDTEIKLLEEDILDARRMFRSQMDVLIAHHQQGDRSTSQSGAGFEKPATSFLGMRTF